MTAFLFTLFSTDHDSRLPWVFGFFLLIFILLAFSAFLQIRTRWKFKPGQLALPRWPLRQGERYVVKYRRLVRGSVELESVTARLRCLEITVHRHNRSDHTHTEVVYEQQLKPLKRPHSGGEIVVRLPLTIPADRFPTLEARHHRLIWELSIVTHFKDFPSDSSEFNLLVAPEVAHGPR